MKKLFQVFLQLFYGDLLCRVLPVKQNRILFSSFFGQHYSDGPRAISERLHARYPKTEIWWAFQNDCGHRLPDYIHTVRMDRPKYFRIKATSAFLVTNVYQQAVYLSGHSSRDILTRLHLFLENRKKQSVLTTWHGTPYKKMGRDQEGGRDAAFLCNQPCYYLVGNAFEESVMQRLTQNQMQVLRFGSPRSVNAGALPPVEAAARKRALGIDPEARIVLYAPTFRSETNGRGSSVEASGLSQLRALDLDELRSCLRRRFGWEKLVLVCRFHNLVERAVDWKRIDPAIVSGNQLEDILDYYQIADLVITDYSSVMFDYMTTRRPVFLLCPDYAHYEREERGLYFTAEELPFSTACSWEELEKQILDFSEESYLSRVDAFMDRLGYYGDEKVLDRTADFLMRVE